MKKTFLVVILLFLIGVALVLSYFDLLPKKIYSSADFGIEVITSSVDYNQNGIDDYTDILLGAKEEAKRHPKYHSAYYALGYPPITEGVCTDVIWRSLDNAGYSLKALMDEDILENVEEYPRIAKIDPNIDFRRVPNVHVFLKRHTISLSVDIDDIEFFQPGDIVVFGSTHIGIISDKRNRKGIPYLIHNSGQIKFEEDVLERLDRKTPITGHYRFSLKDYKK